MENQIANKKKILIVDDDPETCLLLSLLFGQNGYETIIAYRGQEAITWMKQTDLDLVIFDILMPEMDGWETYQRVRDQKDIPAIGMSALPTGEAHDRALKMGIDDFVHKPFNTNELVARVETLVNRARRMAGAHSSLYDRLDQTRPTVSLVIPTLNEAENLPLVLPYIPMAWVDEIILVDGRSTDNTIEVARSLLPSITVLFENNPGKGAAMQAGYEAASGDIIIVLDADGSHDPREIPRFVKALTEGADFAKGSRFAPGGGTTDMPRYRQLGNAFFTLLTNFLFVGTLTDLCYGYHAFWRYCLDSLDISEASGFEIDTALYVSALKNKLRMVEVPSFEGYRFNGTGKLKTIPDGLRVLSTIFQGWLRGQKSSPARDFVGFRGKPADYALSRVVIKENESPARRAQRWDL